MLFIFFFLLFRLLLSNLLHVNEADVLATSRQFMNRDWIPADWYLNQDIGYRVLFNIFVGGLARFFSMQAVSLSGRIVVILICGLCFQGSFHNARIGRPLLQLNWRLSIIFPGTMCGLFDVWLSEA